MLKLKRVLHHADLRQSHLAHHCEVSDATICLLINNGKWPIRIKRESIEPKIVSFLRVAGIAEKEIETCFEVLTPIEQEMLRQEVKTPAGSHQRGHTTHTASASQGADKDQQEDEPMLLRKQSLTPDAKKTFGIFRCPFGEVTSAEEVFISKEIRYVREALWHAAKFGGMYAIAGESGSGKSTIRRDLHDRVQRENALIKLIEPSVVCMEQDDMRGKTLRTSHIIEAIMAEIAPLESLKRSPEARYRQMERALRESSHAGYSHLVIIEEAHCIPLTTLKHLKRLYEIEDGFRRPLGIVLIGQTELAMKLDERNPMVREVVQRCELITLRPLGEDLKPYVASRFKHVGIELSSIMDDAAIEGLRDKLTSGRGRPGQGGYSLLYPLAIGNVLIAAMNAAAEYGIPKITADLIREV